MIELAFSILSADFARLAEGIAAAERGGGTIVHVDVMDGHFVPNITFGPPVVKAVRAVTKLPLDCHLMIEQPDLFIEDFAKAGADMISVHQEVCRHLHRTLQLIEQHGMKPAVVINPATPVETLVEVLPMIHHVLVMSVNPGFGGQKFLPLALDKIAHLAELRQAMGLNFPHRSRRRRCSRYGGERGRSRSGHAGSGLGDFFLARRRRGNGAECTGVSGVGQGGGPGGERNAAGLRRSPPHERRARRLGWMTEQGVK